MSAFRRTAVPLMVLVPLLSAAAQTPEMRGLLTAWAGGGLKTAVQPYFGLRYLPEFSLGREFRNGMAVDAEFSLNAYGTLRFESDGDTITQGEVRPYRAWARFSTNRFEARLGLQKINFGSASLLRPLMWFDTIDPRDPLQLTDGVYGLLLRYTFQSNANIWLWGLYGNDGLRGWDTILSDKDIPEFGGRVQAPLPGGELAFSFHHRELGIEGLLGPVEPLAGGVPENRYGLDGKWDVGIGVWFEGVLIHQHTPALPYPWQRALNLGMDYTFGWGNGLNLTAEHFLMSVSRETWGRGETFKISAIALNYPLGLLDTLTGIVYYDWENRDFYNFLRWQRTYDRWSFNVMAFWNPERFDLRQAGMESDLFSGRGIQIMVVFHH